MYSECIYKHKEQIFGLSPCPYDPELCFVLVGCDSGVSLSVVSLVDTKRGVLYKLENLPITYQPEEKGVESIQEEVVENGENGENNENGESTESAEPAESAESANSSNSTEPAQETEATQREEPAAAEDKPENEEMEVSAEPAEESLPDDKKDEVMEAKPTELVELAVLPRENVVR